MDRGAVDWSINLQKKEGNKYSPIRLIEKVFILMALFNFFISFSVKARTIGRHFSAFLAWHSVNISLKLSKKHEVKNIFFTEQKTVYFVQRIEKTKLIRGRNILAVSIVNPSFQRGYIYLCQMSNVKRS